MKQSDRHVLWKVLIIGSLLGAVVGAVALTAFPYLAVREMYGPVNIFAPEYSAIGLFFCPSGLLAGGVSALVGGWIGWLLGNRYVPQLQARWAAVGIFLVTTPVAGFLFLVSVVLMGIML